MSREGRTVVDLTTVRSILGRRTGSLSMLLGAGIAAAVALGPLGLQRIALHTSERAENQFLGGELVSLGLVAPLAVVGGMLASRRPVLGAIVSFGPALYAIYTYVSVIAGQEYSRYPGNAERYLPLYSLLVIGGGLVAYRSWCELRTRRLPKIGRRLRVSLAVALGSLGGFFALAWGAQIAAVVAGRSSVEYHDDPRLFWTIKALDCGLVIPASIATAVGLLRQRAWAERLVFALTPFATCMVTSVAGMAAMMARNHDASSQPVMLVVSVPVSLMFAGLSGALLVHVLRNSSGEPDVVRDIRGVPVRG
jgi:hypothetical protein